MSTVLLVRHGRTTANAGGTLAGWTPGVHLDDRGRAQAAALAERLAGLPVAAVVSSPLERCRETAEPLAAARDLEVELDDRLGECRYGEWTGAALKDLARQPLWKVVQQHPSAVVFPGGESLRAVQERAVDAVRAAADRAAAAHGDDALVVAVSHGDVIKAVLADALGMHLDCFQRLVIDPASVSAVTYTPLRPFVSRVGDTGDLAGLAPPKRRRGSRRPRRGGPRDAGVPETDAVVGGGAGAP
jgi:probable phosphomutase (TIGR03848 family)